MDNSRTVSQTGGERRSNGLARVCIMHVNLLDLHHLTSQTHTCGKTNERKHHVYTWQKDNAAREREKTRKHRQREREKTR